MVRKKASSTETDSKIIENPQTADEFADRGWFQYSSKAYEQAEADFRHSLDLAPDNPDVMYALGLTMAYAGKTQQAISTFQDVIEYMNDHINDENRVRYNMLIRLSKGHINHMKTGEWRLGGNL